MKTSIRLALLATAAMLLPMTAAHAQTYSRLVSFGDSLSDNGNLYLATSGTQPPAPYNKRFTNDLVWAEYLAGSMQGFFTATSYTSGNFNSAFGGARTDAAVVNPPGTSTQIASFLAHHGTFGANDVVSMWAGANDIFQAVPGAAGNPSTAASVMTGVSVTAATNVATQVGTLAGAGAKTILVMNLPDLGQTPQFTSSASASALGTVSATAFNTALSAGLNTVAGQATGTNIVQVDIQSAFSAIIANPSAFGISNATQACITVTSCVTGGASVQNTYLFFDGVHPTSTGHKLVAAMAAQYLYTPTLTEGAGMLADETYNTRRATAADMAEYFHGGNGYFVQVVGQQASREKDISTQSTIGGTVTAVAQKAYDYSLGGVRAGAVSAMSDTASFGIGFTALTGTSRGFLVEAKPTDLSGDIGIDWHPGNLFVTAQVGGGLGSYSDYSRATTIAAFHETHNQIDVSSYSASLQAGLDHHLGNWTVTPVARLSYAGADMKGFSEAGTIAAVKFDDRKVSALNGAVELRALGKLSDTTSLSAVIGYEGALSSTEGALKGKLINNTAQAFATDMGEVGSPGVLVGLGLSSHVWGMDLSAQYRGTFGSDNARDQSGMIAFSTKF